MSICNTICCQRWFVLLFSFGSLRGARLLSSQRGGGFPYYPSIPILPTLSKSSENILSFYLYYTGIISARKGFATSISNTICCQHWFVLLFSFGSLRGARLLSSQRSGSFPYYPSILFFPAIYESPENILAFYLYYTGIIRVRHLVRTRPA